MASEVDSPKGVQFSMRRSDIERLDELVKHYEEMTGIPHNRSHVVRRLIIQERRKMVGGE